MQKSSHLLHDRFGVTKEQIEACTEVVLAGLAVPRRYKSILRTATVAQRSHFTTAALRRQRVSLIVPELALLGGSDNLH